MEGSRARGTAAWERPGRVPGDREIVGPGATGPQEGNRGTMCREAVVQRGCRDWGTPAGLEGLWAGWGSSGKAPWDREAGPAEGQGIQGFGGLRGLGRG